jgi:predicted MFS family arabinose efflux permease
MGRSFNALWLGQTISLFGDYISIFTVPAFVLQLSDRATDFTNIYAAENLPTLVFGFLGGVLVDRFSRRRMALLADVLRALAFGALALVASRGTAEVWMLVGFAFAVGTFAAAFNSALMSFIPSVVRSEDLAVANGRMAVSQQIAFATGPVLGAVLVDLTNFSIAFAVNAATFLISAMSLLVARPIFRQQRAGQATFLAQLAEGLTFIWRTKVLRYTVLGAAGTNFVTALFESTILLMGGQVFGMEDASAVGWMLGALGAGGVVGALSAAGVIRRIGLGRAAVVGLLMFGTGLSTMALQRTIPTISLAAFLGFIGVPWLNVAIVTIRQNVSPDAILGRVTAASRAIAWGSLPIGAMTAGYLADNVIGLGTLAFVGPLFIVALGLALIPTVVWRTR